MNMKLSLSGALILLSAILYGCGGGSDSNPGTPPGGGSGNAKDVTLNGVISTNTTSTNTAGLVGKTASPIAASNLSGYALYCITFTKPSYSGTGNLIANGSGSYDYSVTIPNAADQAVGCFIVDTANNNTVVSTVTFNTGGGMTGSSSGAALTGGTHTININYDPSSGSATATISSGLSTGGTGNYTSDQMLALISGSWDFSCPDTEPNTPGIQADPACSDAMSKPDAPRHVYLNMLKIVTDSGTLYGMGVWPDAKGFSECGGHEGMNATALGEIGLSAIGVSQVSSTNGASPVGVFTDSNNKNTVTAFDQAALNDYINITYEPNYNEARASISLADLITAIPPTGGPVEYTDTWNDSYTTGHDNSDDWCPSNLIVNADTLVGTTTDTARARICYIGWVTQSVAGRNPASPQTQPCLPQVDSGPVFDQIWTWDNTNSKYLNTDNSLITVPFLINAGGVSLKIPGRTGVLGVEVYGDAVIAHDSHDEQWTQWDDSTHTSYECRSSEEIALEITPSSDTKASGHFIQRKWQHCDDGSATPAPTITTFDLDLNKTVDAL